MSHIDDEQTHVLSEHKELGGKTSMKEQHRRSKEALPDNGTAAAKLGSRLDQKTGRIEPRTGKYLAARAMQFSPVSEAYKSGYNNIKWRAA
jgi:hypothetical protein